MTYVMDKIVVPFIGFFFLLVACILLSNVLHTPYQDLMLYAVAFSVMRDSWALSKRIE